MGLLGASAALITASSTTAQAGPSSSVCAGVTGCKVVVQRDVDGDGRGDQVGIVQRHVDDNGSVTVRVRTAKGKHLQITNRDVNWYGKAWLGSAAIDGRRGAELVVGQDVGAHSMQFRVITCRQGKLVWLWAPKPFAGHATGISRKNWLIDSSYSFDTGIYRSVTIATYTWRSDHWAKQSFRTVTRGDRTAAELGGWHVKGLPRFPRW
jgi:hypothetical protein